MHDYTIKFAARSGGRPTQITFQAQDTTKAMFLASRERDWDSAELWCDGAQVCTIDRADHNLNDFWIVR